jgi:hypothetical protein
MTDADRFEIVKGSGPDGRFAELRTARGPVSENAVGEPKQAQAWLTELGES